MYARIQEIKHVCPWSAQYLSLPEGGSGAVTLACISGADALKWDSPILWSTLTTDLFHKAKHLKQNPTRKPNSDPLSTTDLRRR